MSEWQPIETAPLDTAVKIKTLRGVEFYAIRDVYCETENGADCIAWREVDEGKAPSCWSDGVCWSENIDGEQSDMPVSWMPLPRKEGPTDEPR
jgi:hypothetical protein